MYAPHLFNQIPQAQVNAYSLENNELPSLLNTTEIQNLLVVCSKQGPREVVSP